MLLASKKPILIKYFHFQGLIVSGHFYWEKKSEINEKLWPSLVKICVDDFPTNCYYSIQMLTAFTRKLRLPSGGEFIFRDIDICRREFQTILYLRENFHYFRCALSLSRQNILSLPSFIIIFDLLMLFNCFYRRSNLIKAIRRQYLNP